MSESVEDSRRSDKTSALIEDIVELRQFTSEKSKLVKTTQFYIDMVSKLEVHVSELKAQLMGKDYEIELLSSQLCKAEEEIQELKASNSKDFFSKSLASDKITDWIKSDSTRSKCESLKIQLQNEKKHNEIFENQLKQLGNNILLSEDSRQSQELKKMQLQLENLSEDNQILRSKLSARENLNISTAVKSSNSSCLKISMTELESSDSVSIENSTPRLESSIPIINELNLVSFGFPVDETFVTPKKIGNPEPPQTRCKSECPKKALIGGRAVRYVKCNLKEVMNSTLKSRQVVDFCPSSLRKNRVN